MKKRRIRYDRLIAVLMIAFLLFGALGFGAYKLISLFINRNDSLKYHNNACTIYYPRNEYGKSLAHNICDNYEGEHKITYDYQLENLGDYYLLSYESGDNYLLNKDKSEIRISDFSQKSRTIILNSLRYTAKESYGDLAYNAEFMEKTDIDNFDKLDFYYHFEEGKLCLHFNDFDVDADVELAYLQDELNMDFGLENQDYQYVHYVDPNRKMLCLTFDDGPKAETSTLIIDTLAKYDAVGTFFTVGQRLGEKGLGVIEYGLSKGMSYGSHSYDHSSLIKLDLATAVEEIETVMRLVKEKTGYQMKLYRPPYGSINSNVEAALADYTAVLWNVDSLDWSNRLNRPIEEAVNMTKANVLENVDDNDVVLFHDIYEVTVESIKEIVPYLIDQGYQLVSVEEMLHYLDKEGATSFSGK